MPSTTMSQKRVNTLALGVSSFSLMGRLSEQKNKFVSSLWGQSQNDLARRNSKPRRDLPTQQIL